MFVNDPFLCFYHSTTAYFVIHCIILRMSSSCFITLTAAMIESDHRDQLSFIMLDFTLSNKQMHS